MENSVVVGAKMQEIGRDRIKAVKEVLEKLPADPKILAVRSSALGFLQSDTVDIDLGDGKSLVCTFYRRLK